MNAPRFTLLAVVSADGFIARDLGDAPAAWASAEEQRLFAAAVDATDWSIMGRGTHEAAPRPDRRRVVFSTADGGWRSPNQLWLDPAPLAPSDLGPLVRHVHPMRDALVLGGTRVHDWFLRANAIDVIHLTVEPVRFGHGLPLFTGQGGADGPAALIRRGFRRLSVRRLNRAGTRLEIWDRPPAGADGAGTTTPSTGRPPGA